MHTGTRDALRAPGLGLGNTFAVETGFELGQVVSRMLFNLYMVCVIREVMPKINCLGIDFLVYSQWCFERNRLADTGRGRSTMDSLGAADVALMSDDAGKLQRMITAAHLAFQR